MSKAADPINRWAGGDKMKQLPTSLPIERKWITLDRGSGGSGLGFTIRGGIEHGLGHFVSAVDNGSEAQRQGLKPGDQIITVGGLTLTGATHKEAVSLIASTGSKLELQIQSIGAIPIKSHKGDPITWLPCTNDVKLEKLKGLQNTKGTPPPPLPLSPRTSASPEAMMTKTYQNRVLVPITLRLNGNQGLGCIICRGPPDIPGIFVQTIKPGGLALQAGLESGDEIVECNGISFDGVTFQDAVHHLKSSPQIDLIVRKGAGLGFIHAITSSRPSTSEGDFNLIKEAATATRHAGNRKSPDPNYMESASRTENEMYRLDEARKRLEQERLAYERQKIQEASDEHHEELRKLEAERRQLERTKIALERKRLEAEQERIKKETEELEQEKKRFEEERKRRADEPKPPFPNGVPASANDSMDSSGSSSGGLHGAIQIELQRRKANRASENNGAGEVSMAAKKNLANVMKNDQHDKLIAEFRQVHQRMFSNSSSSSDGQEQDLDIDAEVTNHTEHATNNRHQTKVTFNDDVTTFTSMTTKSAKDNTPTLKPFSRADQKLSKPKAPPPPPPVRSSSMNNTSSEESSLSSTSVTTAATMSTFKPSVINLNSSTPIIPEPDYDSDAAALVDSNSPERGKPKELLSQSKSLPNKVKVTASNIKKPRVAKTFSLDQSQEPADSYLVGDKPSSNTKKGRKPSPLFIDPAKSTHSSQPLHISPYTEKNSEVEQFNFLPQRRNADTLNKHGILMDEALIASQDYRVANAVGINGQTQVDILTTLSRRTILADETSSMSSHSKKNQKSSPSPPSIEKVADARKNSSSSSSAIHHPQKKSHAAKKGPAPPPPPPPPTVNDTKGIK